MGICTAVNYVKACIFPEPYVIGHKIFKPLCTKIDVDKSQFSPETQDKITKCEAILSETENCRKEIATKFENMLVETGSCVLRQPTFERSVITYIVNLLTQIKISAKKNNVQFDANDFSIKKIFGIKSSLPFIEINDGEMRTLKDKYGFDFEQSASLQKGKESIVDFLKSATSCKELIGNQVSSVRKLVPTDLNEIKLLKEFTGVIDGMIFLYDLFSELLGSTNDIQSQIVNPNKMVIFHNVSAKAAESGLTDPKDICFNYSNGDTCGKVENYRENLTYIETEPMKY